MIKGLQKLTLLDYPGVIAATVFLGGCNLRCPFCHNASLVLLEKYGETISDTDFFAFLDSRRDRIQGICVSGGEPTLYPQLEEFIREIKDRGFLVKLDTNGTRPEVLRRLVENNLLDYVAMDIKNSPLRYGETVGITDFDPTPIAESAAILMNGKTDFEFRTTVVRELHTPKDIEQIGEWLSGDEKFFLQTFVDSGDLIGTGYSGYTACEMEELTNLLKKYIPKAQKRG
ncbi:MAG: anaerobic ribonucleoside-triphosphate reductase activating protein [Clostridia bacterium]|nr:anaerobic ribonucleoside-triphosphate reductase activating protein [Clostridia bacterium]